MSSYRAVNKKRVPKAGADQVLPQENLFAAEGELEEELVNNEKEMPGGPSNGEEGIQNIYGDKEVEVTNEEDLVHDEHVMLNGTNNGEEGTEEIQGDEEVEGSIEEELDNVEGEKQDGANNDKEGIEITIMNNKACHQILERKAQTQSHLYPIQSRSL